VVRLRATGSRFNGTQWRLLCRFLKKTYDARHWSSDTK
jgi:hypothetical protein